MSTLDYKKEQKRGFFSIYKPGQGKYVRWGTVAGAGIFILIGAGWLGETQLASFDIPVRATGVMLWIALGALLTFWAVNKPSLAEFMIMTESEMRKVTWPTRRETIVATKVVIFLTLLLAALLWLVDYGLVTCAQWAGIM